MSNLWRCDCGDHQNGLNKVRIHWMCLIKSLPTTAQAVVRDSGNDGTLINVRNPEERLRSKVRNPEISRHWGQMYHLALVKSRSSNTSRGSHPFSFGLVLKYLLCRFWPGNQDIVGLEFPNAMVEMSKYLLFHNASGCNCRENSLQIFTATTFDALSVEEIVAG